MWSLCLALEETARVKPKVLPPHPAHARTHARTPLRFNSVSKTRYFVTLLVPFPHPVTWKFSDVVAPNPALAPHLPSLCGRRQRVGRPPPAPLLVRGRASSLIPRLLHWSLSKAGPRPQAGRPCARAGPGAGKGPGLGGRARARRLSVPVETTAKARLALNGSAGFRRFIRL